MAAGGAVTHRGAGLDALAAELPERRERKAVLGVVAVLLGRALHIWGPASSPWCSSFLRELASILDLPTEVEALEILCDPAAETALAMDPTGFVEEVPLDKRARVAMALLAVTAAADVGYDARTRQVYKGLCSVFGVSLEAFADAEDQVARRIAEAQAGTRGDEAGADAPSAAEDMPWRGRRTWAQTLSIGAAAVIGGGVIAATAGLAAPAVGVGLAAVSGIGGAATAGVVAPIAGFLGTAAGAATFTTLFGATGAGLAAYKTKRRVGGLSEFSFQRLKLDWGLVGGGAVDACAGTDGAVGTGESTVVAARGVRPVQHGGASREAITDEEPRLTLQICISGWMSTPEDTAERQWLGRKLQDNDEAMQRMSKAPTAQGGGTPAANLGAPRPEATPSRLDAAAADPSATASTEPSAPAPAAAASDGSSRAPCQVLQPHAEQWLLVWEQKELLRLGRALNDLVASEAVSLAVTQVLKQTVLHALLAALATTTLVMKAADVIDNPWAVAHERAKKAGVQVAQALVQHAQGRRPVSLVGYSLGARVVVSCLQALDALGEEGLGIVEDVCLLGAPVELQSSAWGSVRRVAAGRIVNCYSSSDWVLGLAYRANSPGAVVGIAGISPVARIGVENVDVSDIVNGHLGYPDNLGAVLERVALAVAEPCGAQGGQVSLPASLSRGAPTAGAAAGPAGGGRSGRAGSLSYANNDTDGSNGLRSVCLFDKERMDAARSQVARNEAVAREIAGAAAATMSAAAVDSERRAAPAPAAEQSPPHAEGGSRRHLTWPKMRR